MTCLEPSYPHSTVKEGEKTLTPGSTQEVKCDPGLVNIGSQTITCQEERTWGFEIQPSCQELGETRSDQQIYDTNTGNNLYNHQAHGNG